MYFGGSSEDEYIIYNILGVHSKCILHFLALLDFLDDWNSKHNIWGS